MKIYETSIYTYIVTKEVLSYTKIFKIKYFTPPNLENCSKPSINALSKISAQSEIILFGNDNFVPKSVEDFRFE